MATPHPRIAVVHDDELDRALQLAEPLLSAEQRRSQAARVRALAIRGAAAMVAEHGDENVRIEDGLRSLDATRSTARWDDLPAAIVVGDPAERAGSAALDDVRGSR